MWVLWMKEKRSVGVDDCAVWPMLMRWCIRHGALKDKVGPLVYEVDR